MQRLSRELHRALAARVPVRAVLWGGTSSALPIFGGLAALRAWTWLMSGQPTNQRPEIILAGDVSLAPLAVLLGQATNRAVAVVAHGKDILFSRFGYQSLIAPWMRQCDVVIGISEHAQRLAITAGVDRDKTFVGGCAVESQTLPGRAFARRLLSTLLGHALHERPIVLSISRAVERKGTAWFVQNVWPGIIESVPDALFVAIGDGPEIDKLRSVAASFPDSVFAMGRVSESVKLAALASADLFVMPNLAVENDTEGFGLVAAEAAHAGIPTVAADLEGITEAVVPGRTGVLVASNTPAAMSTVINHLLMDPVRRKALGESARATASELFVWQVVGDQYVGGLKQGIDQWRSRVLQVSETA